MAALILKPLSDAIQDGDTIRAVIRGTAVNSNGKGPGITLPSREAQVSLIRSAYRQAGCDPAVTGYCEAHGTGTAAGDPLEAGALGDALGVYRPDGVEGKLFVGSIKTNIGHLEGASGLAALVKTVMSLEKGIIAPNLWYEKGNPAIDFDAWRIRVPTEVTPWPTVGLRRASVNGFGYGGTNGHVILDDAYHYMRERGLNGKHQTCIPSGSDTDSLTSWDVVTSAERPRIFYLSAHEPASVLHNAKSHAAHLISHQSRNDDLSLDDLAFTLCERRSRHEIASTIVASSKQELIEGLESLTTTTRRSLETPRLGFIFTGQGAQWWAMGRELVQYPVFAQSLAACHGAIQSFGSSWSLLGRCFYSHSFCSFANDQLTHSVLCR
jgi:acyl transferase domain-containing protein